MTAVERYDYVIVGAGSAGCVLANRLSAEPGATVLLLEAGPPDREMEIGIPAAFPKLFRTKYDWSYTTTEQRELAGRALFWPRGRTLGGSSAINAQMYVRGNAADYDRWAAARNPGWSWPDVLPAFRQSECNARGASEFHGADGPLSVEDLRDPNPLTRSFLRAAVEVGIPMNPDLNGARQDGVSLSQVTQRRGKRASTAHAFLKPIRRRRNLTVLTDAQAMRVVLEGERAVGVEYRHDGRVETATARNVILSGGAINSPQLLMLSGIGPGPELERLGLPVVRDLPAVGRHLQDTCGVILLQPASEGEVVLDSVDPFQPARIEPRYLSDPGGDDLRVLARGVEIAREILRAPALASSVEAEMWPGAEVRSDAEISEFVRRRAETLYHPVGTCRMGPDPADAVVDPTLQVHGISGLHVVDASVMPRIVRGNTNAPTIMIAERAAALISAVPSNAARI